MNLIHCDPDSRLTSEEWSQLTRISRFYEKFCVQAFVQSHQFVPLVITTQPCRTRFKLQRFIDLHFKYIQVIASFIHHILKYNRYLSAHYYFIKKTFKMLTLLNAHELIHYHVLEQTPWTHDRCLFESVITTHQIERLEKNILAYKTSIPYDPFIFKLFLIILALSPSIVPRIEKSSYQSSDFFSCPKIIFENQNQYSTLLWKYLLYRFDHRQAVIYLVRLVQTFLHQQTIEADTMEILSNRDDHGRLLETLDNI